MTISNQFRIRSNVIEHMTARPLDSHVPVGHYLPIGALLSPSRYLQPLSRQWAWKILDTFRFKGHVTSSVTWPFDSWGPFPIGGPLDPSLYLWQFPRYSTPNIMCSYTQCWTVIVHARYHVMCTSYVKFKNIFQFLTLLIHWVFSLTSNVKSQSSKKFRSPKICQILTF